MSEEKLVNRTIKDLEGKERPKKLMDYTGEELDSLAESDPEYESKLWDEAEIEALNNPNNHNKSN